MKQTKRLFMLFVSLTALLNVSAVFAQGAIGGGGGGGGGVGGGSTIVQAMASLPRLGGDMGGGAYSYLSGPGGGGGGIGTSPVVAAYLLEDVHALIAHDGHIVERDEIRAGSRLSPHGLELSYSLDSRGAILVNPDVYKEVLMDDGYFSVEGPTGTGGIGQN